MTERSRRNPRVFLSYAIGDQPIASRIATAIRESGESIHFDQWGLSPLDSIRDRIEERITSSDIFLILLSKQSTQSRWVQAELNVATTRELNDRAIAILPVLINDCDIPPALKEYKYIDLRRNSAAGIRALVNQLNAAAAIDFSTLTSKEFEDLIADLLVERGFSIARDVETKEHFDFVARHKNHDPFGVERTETWAVEVKLYRDKRASVSALKDMFHWLLDSLGQTKGLVITNGQLTSEARSFASSAGTSSGRELRVIDGTELTRILIQHPNLVHRYFSNEQPRA
jgi:hypothetical protein